MDAAPLNRSPNTKRHRRVAGAGQTSARVPNIGLAAGMATPKSRTAVRTLAIGIGIGGQLPSEFRLFTRGWNDTENGRFLFDEEAAKATMAAYQKWGVDLMIDLEHQALATNPPPEPTARDARGWCRLELRPDGSLWAVGVTWTPDGAQRLSEKRQRYVSPAFIVDPDTSRITSIINVAIVAIPATHQTPALVAASARGDAVMNSEMVQKALDALIANDAPAALEILKGLVVEAAGGEAESEEPEPLPDDAAVEEVAKPQPLAVPEEQKSELVAASNLLMRLSGAATPGAAVEEAQVWRASHLRLETETQKLAAERAVMEAAKRRKGCVDLVTLGGHAPATVWADPECSGPKKYLAAMSMNDFEDYVADTIKANGGKRAAPVPPPSAQAGPGTLSEREIALCDSKKLDPAKYAAIKSQLGKT